MVYRIVCAAHNNNGGAPPGTVRYVAALWSAGAEWGAMGRCGAEKTETQA